MHLDTHINLKNHQQTKHSQQSEDVPEKMQVDQATETISLRKQKEKVHKNLKRGANVKEMDIFTKRVLRITMDKP